MNRAHAAVLWASDLKNMARDRTVGILFVVPFIFVALLRFGIPLLEGRAPWVGAYRPYILALFSMLAGTFPAFMASFLMLDEKDESLFLVFRVLPISPHRFLLYRLALVVVLSFVYPLILMAGSGLMPYSPATIVALAALCTLLSPTVTLVVVSVAGNKIEGITVLKALYFAMALPLLGIFAEAGWTFVFAVLPSYWIFEAFAATDAAARAWASVGAVVTHAAVAAAFYRRFRRRVFP